MMSGMLLILAALVAGQVFFAWMTRNFKTVMIERDYAIAGYLARTGVDETLIIAALPSEPREADIEAGALLLAPFGYSETMSDDLLPSAKGSYQKYAIVSFLISLPFAFVFLGILYIGALHRDRQFESADEMLRHFMDGDSSIRLTDCDEGNLYKLFTTINTMMTSLTVHIEKEKQNRRSLKNTISDISHQLKTPLAALLLYNEIIRDEKIDNTVVEDFTEKSRRELIRMESLIQSLLKLARLDAGTVELKKSVCEIGKFLKECLEPFFARADREGKNILINCDDSITLRIDALWFGEALGNIVKNALDNTAYGDCVEISCSNTAVSTEIIIRDNGTGIHPEDIHHIFKRFYRSRFSNDGHGVGIGLALSKSIVEKHGGTIAVQSELGNGSEFHLIFSKLTNL